MQLEFKKNNSQHFCHTPKIVLRFLHQKLTQTN